MSWTFGLLLDEHAPWALYNSLLKAHPTLRIFRINDGIAPPNGTPDPILLKWCEANDCALVTDNRSSMPTHLAEHCRQGGHIQGIFTVKFRSISAKLLVDRLALVAGASLEGEYRDTIAFLPATA